MFSSDKNIETIGQLAEMVRHYVGLQTEYVKLDVIEKVVRLLTAVAMLVVISVLVILLLIYLSFAAAHALTPLTGAPVAFLLVAAFYLLLLVLTVMFRKRWIERPLVRFLANLLME